MTDNRKERMNASDSNATLITVLNDGSRTRIADPWRGGYHVAIDVTDQADVDELREQLNALGVAHQVNLGARDRIAIYEPDGIARLLQLGDRLDPRVGEKLDTLVRARGPVPDAIVNRILDYRSMGMDWVWIADLMNRKRVVDGMGGKGWTPDQVKRAARRELPTRLRVREAA
jgi:hypothetical protein